MTQRVLQSLHDHDTAGYMGFQRTLDRVMERFYWPGACEEVRRDYCRSCVLCQRRNRSPITVIARLQTEFVSHPFERVAKDITEIPCFSRGNRYALVTMNYFSKLVRWTGQFPETQQRQGQESSQQPTRATSSGTSYVPSRRFRTGRRATT